MLKKRVAVISSQVGWHTQRLLAAFTTRHCEASVFDLSECEFFVTQGKQAIVLPGFEDNLPDAVFVRCIPNGSFEQVTFYLDILHSLQASGVVVYNHACAIERTVDKAMTTFLLRQAGLPTPQTWVSANRQRVAEIINQQLANDKALVIKPLFGSQGKDLQLINSDHAEPYLAEDSVYYLQEFVNGETTAGHWHDWRLFVIGGRVVAAIKRNNDHWINNVAQGSQCEAAEPAQELVRYAEQAVSVIGAFYAGVDLICDKSGKTWVIEVNSIPAWQGLQSVNEIDIAKVLVDDLLAQL